MNSLHDFPFFSIVIPLYNKENFIQSTLLSVFSQTYSNYEVIVINDGCTDNSVALVEAFNNNKLQLIHQKNSGVSKARNLGILRSKGKYICFLDADDIWLDHHLQSFLNSITQFPNEKVYSNNYKIRYSSKSFRSTKFNYLPSANNGVIRTNFFESSLKDSVAHTSSICIQNDVFKSILIFDETLEAGEDTDLWIRLGLIYSFVFNCEVSMIYNKSILGSLSKNNNRDSLFRMTQKFLKQEKTNTSLKKFIDINRFSLALECLEFKDYRMFNILKSQVKWGNLNWSQRLLLKTPAFMVSYLKLIKKWLNKQKIFISIYG